MFFCINLPSILKEWGVEINPYNWYVSNKTVNNKKLTAVWHVDDIKILHVEELIAQLSERYGKEADLTFHKGKMHAYLGMRFY